MNIEQEYKTWISALKDKIRTSQLKAAISVNSEMISLYWEIGADIVQKQVGNKWGSGFIKQMAKDFKNDMPEVSGFSQTNLYAMRQFYLFYNDKQILQQAAVISIETNEIQQNTNFQQPVGNLREDSILTKIPWGHHYTILQKCKQQDEAFFYINQTLKNNWSRNILQIQIESRLHERQGKALHNFERTLPAPLSDLARETLKDPYKFDFLTLESNIQELELEKKLTENISLFLLELGKGFAFVGRQYPLQIGKKERKIDLLFYHTKLHCYVAVDLKMGEFEPEYAGKMNYYLSAIDEMLKTDIDQPSIGIILCKSKDAIDVEYALRYK